MRRRGHVDRVAREVRIGDVALHADHRQPRRQAAAAAVLDHVAERRRRRSARRRCSSRASRRAPASASTTRTVPSTDGPSSSLVSRNARRPAWRGMRGDEFLGGDDHRGQRGLHVGGAAAVQLAVAVGRHEGRAVPLVDAGRWARRRCGRPAPASGPGARRCARPTGCRRGRPSGPNGRCSQTKPSASSRCAISAWQPASSGVTDARAISCSSRRSVASTGSSRASIDAGARCRPGAGAAPTGGASGSTSSVISVNDGASDSTLAACTRDTGAMSFCRRHSRLVGESAPSRPSSCVTRPRPIRRAMSCLEDLRAFGQRLVHRLAHAAGCRRSRSARR